MEITHVKQHESIINKMNENARIVKPIEKILNSHEVILKYKNATKRINKKGTKVDIYV